jgi:gliding motility-associated-like protein
VLVLPKLSIPPVPDVVAGMPVTILSVTDNDVVKWRWTPATQLSCSNCASPVSTPLNDIVYKLTVTNKNGCTSSGQVSIKTQCKESIVMVPSAFSPNNDGLNDVFTVRGITTIKNLAIYNRWGNIVYEKINFFAGDRSNGWDGTFKGEPQPPGTYLYFIQMECPGGNLFVKKGTLVLVK